MHEVMRRLRCCGGKKDYFYMILLQYGGPEASKVVLDYGDCRMWRSFQIFKSFFFNIRDINQNSEYWSRTLSICYLQQLSSNSETLLQALTMRFMCGSSYFTSYSGLISFLLDQASWHSCGLNKSLAKCW